MTTVSIGLAVALFLIVHACMKWGVVIALRSACLLFLSVPVFWFSALIVTATMGSLGIEAPPSKTLIAVGSVIVLLAWQIAKRTGWATVLGGAFVAAVGFCGVVLLLSYFFALGVVLHAGIEGMIFIFVATAILWVCASSYRARGR